MKTYNESVIPSQNRSYYREITCLQKTQTKTKFYFLLRLCVSVFSIVLKLALINHIVKFSMKRIPLTRGLGLNAKF